MSKNAANDLYTCWPDVPLVRLFRQVRSVYEEIVQTQSRKRGASAVQEAFSQICGWVTGDAMLHELRELYGTAWPQAAASILGMLMHLSVRNKQAALRNERRPAKEFSTYPTSPAVANLAAEYVLGQVLPGPVPDRIRDRREAERYAARSMCFKVLDPSMESGQMLLAVAVALLARLERVSAGVETLREVMLTRLCRECLWGIDRNPLAPLSLAAVFSALGRHYGFDLEAPRNLLSADALRWGIANPRRFEAVINNPPWGEKTTAAERDWIRGSFDLAGPRIDTYAAFTQLAIESLAPGGAYALVLPAYFLSSQTAGELRTMLSGRSELCELLVAPRHAFAPATVLSCLLKGRLKEPGGESVCNATVHPFRKALEHRGRERKLVLRSEELRSSAGESWWTLLHGRVASPSPKCTRPLQELAQVYLGCQVYGVGKGRPPQSARIVRSRPYTSPTEIAGWRPAVQVRDIQEFHTARPGCFVNFGIWLARPGLQDALARRRRILVRELCSREGTLKAAVTTGRAIALHGVFTLVPDKIDPYLLAAILNSSYVAECVRASAASFTKVDFQRITTTELRRLPIPISATNSESAVACRLIRLARHAHRLGGKSPCLRESLIEELDSLVGALYESC